MTTAPKARAPRGDRRYKSENSHAGDDQRKRLIVAVRAACRRLGIGEDDRKAIQDQVTGKASMSDMTIAQLGLLLSHLNKGWDKPEPLNPHIGKARALWWDLYWLGAIDEPGDKALSAFVRRQTGISALRFLDHRQAFSVIEALKAMVERAGVQWPSATDMATVCDFTPHWNAALGERLAVINALGEALRSVGALRAGHLDYLQSALGLANSHYHWSTSDMDAAIRLLGRKLRKAREDSARAVDAS
jgi:phage gp16-like protein